MRRRAFWSDLSRRARTRRDRTRRRRRLRRERRPDLARHRTPARRARARSRPPSRRRSPARPASGNGASRRHVRRRRRGGRTRRRDGGPATRAARRAPCSPADPQRARRAAVPLSGREAPEAVMLTDRCAGLVDDRPALRREPVPTEERAVVVAGEEARLLALGAVGCVEPGARRLGAGLGLVLLAEREPDAV